jgi:CHAT domain-containing protein
VSVGVDEYRVPGVGAGPLDGAEEAAAEIARLYADGGYEAERLLGEQAREDAVRALLADPGSPPGCVHLTLHGASVESDTPLESWLLLARSRLDGIDLLEWRLAGATVVLSACSSGQRAIGARGMDELPGDDLLGLQAALFAAGARHVLGALWPVDLDIARGVTRRFHVRLLEGRPADVALRLALLGHLETADVRTRQSRCWAPFQLTSHGVPRSIGRRG